MKTYNYKMTRVYETLLVVDAENEQDASNKLKENKKMIIENFMIWYTGELTELMQDFINEYVEDDHVNELTK